MNYKVQKFHCQLCNKDTMSTFWGQKGMVLCLECKRKLDESIMKEPVECPKCKCEYTDIMAMRNEND